VSRPLIEIKNLSKHYGTKIALDKINIKLYKNEVVGLLGLNGAGKSTCLKILAGILPPTEGEIYLNNEILYSSNDIQTNDYLTQYKSKIAIGYLPEFISLYPELTIKDFLHFMMVIKDVPKHLREEQLQNAIKKTHLEEYQDTLIKYLSLGYQKRTGIAQTILGNPTLIILDEPISGLDPRQIIEIRNLIRELAKEHTILLSSHILSEVAQTCDRVYILHSGKIVKEVEKGQLSQIENIFMEATNA
jgi:ABC-2 type transport system ATP-binding protein